MIDARLVGRVIDAARTVNPLLPVTAAVLDLQQPPTSGSVRAQVAARLADGTFRVLIDGKALKLALPADIKPGDVLQLRIIGQDAVATSPGGTGAQGNGVSSAGQFVADLVKQPNAPPARQAQPVLDVPPKTPAELPEPLARAVERSGLFYESHQARWVGGEFPLERLLQEPQAAAGRPAAAPAQHDAPLEADTAEPPPPPGQAAQRPVAALPAESNAEAPTDTRSAVTTEAQDNPTRSVDKGAELVARETLALVRQQLETLETRQFQWLGEIWPGQTMRWEIGEEGREQDGNRDAEHAWDSRFTLDLPALGSVGAELQLRGQQLRIRISARDEATANSMREAGRELSLALEAAGIQSTLIEVQHREPAL